MKKPYWEVYSIGAEEPIIQVKYREEKVDEVPDVVKRMVSQFYEEEWEDCFDGVRVSLVVHKEERSDGLEALAKEALETEKGE